MPPEGETPAETPPVIAAIPVPQAVQEPHESVSDAIRPLHEAVLANTQAIGDLARIVGDVATKMVKEPATAIAEVPPETVAAAAPAIEAAAAIPEAEVTAPSAAKTQRKRYKLGKR